MSTDRDTPRGPTATELRRRVLAHVERVASVEPVPDYPPAVTRPSRCAHCGRLSPQGCLDGPCSFHAAPRA